MNLKDKILNVNSAELALACVALPLVKVGRTGQDQSNLVRAFLHADCAVESTGV